MAQWIIPAIPMGIAVVSLAMTSVSNRWLQNAVEVNDLQESASEIRTTRQKIVKALSFWELDPLNMANFANVVQQKANDTNGGNVDLSVLEACGDNRFQANPFSNRTFGQRCIINLIALMQIGKTNISLFAAFMCGVLHGMPSMMLVFNRENETTRMRESAASFNRIVRICCNKIGVSSHRIPQLQPFETGDEGDFMEALRVMFADRKNCISIPIMFCMSNAQKIGKMADLVQKIADTGDLVGRDARQRMEMLLIMDEAELLLKTMLGTTKSEVNLGREIWLSNSRKSRSTKDAFTSWMNVTATPFAFGCKKESDVKERTISALTARPSQNYWSYAAMGPWNCKLITPVTVLPGLKDSVMIDHMLSDRDNIRMAFSIASSKKSQKEKALKTAREYPCSQLLTVAWNGDKLHVYTSSERWIRELTATTSFNIIPGDDEYVVHFESKRSKGRGELSSNGGLMVNKISTYRGLVTFLSSKIDEASAEQLVSPDFNIKVILYAQRMAERATPIKGFNHELPLTDLFADCPDMHIESLLQILGRLCGIDTIPQSRGKFLWATEKTMERLSVAFDAIPKYTEIVAYNDTITNKRKRLEDTMGDSAQGAIVVDTDGVMPGRKVDNFTRPALQKASVEAGKALVSTKRRKRLAVAHVVPGHEVFSPIQPTTVAAILQAAAAAAILQAAAAAAAAAVAAVVQAQEEAPVAQDQEPLETDCESDDDDDFESDDDDDVEITPERQEEVQRLKTKRTMRQGHQKYAEQFVQKHLSVYNVKTFISYSEMKTLFLSTGAKQFNIVNLLGTGGKSSWGRYGPILEMDDNGEYALHEDFYA